MKRRIQATIIGTVISVLVLTISLMALEMVREPRDDKAKIQKYHERRASGRIIAEKWSKGNISEAEKDDLLRAIAFEMYGVEDAN